MEDGFVPTARHEAALVQPLQAPDEVGVAVVAVAETQKGERAI